MIMGILYIISIISFISSFIIVKKSDNKLSVILWGIIAVILTSIINSLSCYVLNEIHITSYLGIRFIINLILTIINIFIILKTKKIQKYYFSINEMVVTLIILFVSIGLGVYRFGSSFNLDFETTDPAVHYLNADRFASCSRLLEDCEGDIIYGDNEGASMFFGYTNLGTIFQLIDRFNGNFINKTRAFIIFEIIVLFLSSMSVYYCIIGVKRKKIGIINTIFIVIALILCLLGYQYNNIMFGYHYLGLSILLIMQTLIMLEYIMSEKNNKMYMILFGLINMAIFFTYYMFIPVVYGGCGLYLLYKWIIKKELTFKEILKIIGYCLVIPFAIGMFYFFIKSRLSGESYSGGMSAFKLDGYIYRNLIGNFVILIIFVISKLIKNIKDKKMLSYDFVFYMNLLFTLLLLVLFYNDKICGYYYYKLYYLMWPLCFIIIGKYLIDEKLDSINVKIGLFILGILCAVQITEIDEKLFQLNPLLNNTTFVRGIENIYWFNFNKNTYKNGETILSGEEIDSLYNIFSEKDIENNTIVYYGDLLEKIWFYTYIRISPTLDSINTSIFYNDNYEINELIENNSAKYILCEIDECSLYENDYFDEVYNDNVFKLLERNKEFNANNKVVKKS